jgi:hypothetical protein
MKLVKMDIVMVMKMMSRCLMQTLTSQWIMRRAMLEGDINLSVVKIVLRVGTPEIRKQGVTPLLSVLLLQCQVLSHPLVLLLVIQANLHLMRMTFVVYLILLVVS